MTRNPNSQLGRRIPKPSYRHAAPAGLVRIWKVCGVIQLLFRARPWPYIDCLGDQESEERIEASSRSPTVIGSCGHADNCEDCQKWIAYPQSLFGNWTIKPVRKCGIERAVKDNERLSTIYAINVLEDGGFKNSGEICVTSGTKREFWNDVLLKEASAHFGIVDGPYLTIQLSAWAWNPRTCAVCRQHVWSCSPDAWH